MPACETTVVQSLVCRRVRRLTEQLILFLLGLIIFCTWFVAGFPVFWVVQEGSMATTLLGSHVDATCPNCNFTFSCDATYCSKRTTAVCPNCGAGKFPPPTAPTVLAGDRVLVDRTAFQLRRPWRWEVVAFYRWRSGQDPLVKRIVGLPGESIEIKDGDIYADGRIQRKSLRQQRALRVLVHDDDYAGAAPQPRWRPQEAGSNWNRQRGRLVHAEDTGGDIGWLVYNHASPGSDNSDAPERITDYCFYNCGQLQDRNEATHPMADVAMSFRIAEIHGRGLLWLQATDGRDQFMVRIDPQARKFIVEKNREKNRQAPVAATGDLPGPLRGQTIEVSLFDRQLLLAIAGRTLATLNIETPAPPPVAYQPLAIGAEGLGIVIDHLRVYRDVYYAEPPRPLADGRASSCVLGADEYFVLGDNSPISADSRTWEVDRCVKLKSLIGKPFVVIYPSSGISLGGWHIPVPDFARMRYIR